MNPENQNVPPSTPQQTPPAPTTEVHKPKHNSIIFLLSFSLIVFVGIASFLAYQNWQLQKKVGLLQPTNSPIPTTTPDPTADWETYTNTTYGFSFKYPKILSGTEAGVAAPYTGISKDIQSFSDPSTILPNSDASFDGFSLYVVTDPLAANFEDYLSKEKAAMDDSPMPFMAGATRENFENGVSYTKDHMSYYYLPSENNEIIVVFAYVQQNSLFKTTFKEILSTFKFTEDKNIITKKIGYIKLIDNSKLAIDYIDWKNDPSAPNRFKIENPDQSLTTLNLSSNVQVSIISNVHGLTNNSPTLQEFINLINQNEGLKTAPYNIDVENGKIIKISEQYVP